MWIIKKRKGKKDYYYLKHSYREEGKVRTREIYLGEKIPKNINRIKNKLMKEINKNLYTKLESIKKDFQEEWTRVPESAKKEEIHNIAIAFTYNTNAIEGSTITLEEVREIIEDRIAPKKPIRDIKETEDHYKVFLNMLRKKERITKDLLLEWHKNIFSETKPDIAGRFRDYLVRVGDYIAPDWQDINKLMNKFIEFVNEKGMNPVELAGRAHFIFESIHPFGDGNGRIGRLIMNHILWYSGYPMIVIEYKKRSSYYKAFKRGEDGFLNYFLRRYMSIHKKRIKD